MSWRCSKCGYINADDDTSCNDCGYQREKMLSQGDGTRINTVLPMTAGSTGTGQPEANVPQDPAGQGKWVIVCPNCGREIPVEGEDAELEICPKCGSDSIETVHAFFKAEGRPAQAEVQPARHPRLFIQEIKAIPETSNKFVYHQKGRTPEPVSDKSFCPPNLYGTGRSHPYL